MSAPVHTPRDTARNDPEQRSPSPRTPPRGPRVVSLLPSATEILCAIGAADLLVGRSHECDHPAQILDRPVLTAARTRFETSAQVDRDVRAVLGGRAESCTVSLSGGGNEPAQTGPENAASPAASLYSLNEPLLAELRPDVILTQDLCSVCSIDLETVTRLAARLPARPRIVSLNPHTLEAVLDDHLTIAGALGDAYVARATDFVAGLRERIYGAADFVNAFIDGPNVACLEWTDPLFVAGHWVPQMIERAGGRCPLNPTRPLRTAGAAAGPIGTTLRTAGKSVSVPAEVLVASRPERLIIAPCGLSLDAARREAGDLRDKPWWRDLPAVRMGQVALVDGNQFFSRPGPRLVDALEWLTAWLNDRPELVPSGFAWEPFA